MKAALDQFAENIARARAISGLAHSLKGLTTPAIDLTDLYRASIVLGVSALDHFVHEYVRLGMIEVHQGKRASTEANLSFKLPLSAARLGISNPGQDDWLDQAIRDAHSWVSFQTPDKIANAVRLVSNIKLWEEIGKTLGVPAKQAKKELTAIIERRNKIAHEADIDPVNPGFRWPIDEALVAKALDYLERLVNAIFIIVK